MLKKILILFFSIFIFTSSFCQDFKTIYKSMNLKDKLWCVTHYSSVVKAKNISSEVLLTMDSLNKINFLGGNSEGGIFDAFRHIYWMYKLSSGIGPKNSKRIGEIYEGYGKYVFEHSYYSGYDSVGMKMDLFNNEIGITLSKENIPYNLIFKTIEEIITSGKAKIVKKNEKGESLNEYGEVIKDSIWKKDWVNDRVLIDSSI